jgi:hypothetical protein
MGFERMDNAEAIMEAIVITSIGWNITGSVSKNKKSMSHTINFN